jgi:hypothetical protein
MNKKSDDDIKAEQIDESYRCPVCGTVVSHVPIIPGDDKEEIRKWFRRVKDAMDRDHNVNVFLWRKSKGLTN